jgi:hypothetical protein
MIAEIAGKKKADHFLPVLLYLPIAFQYFLFFIMHITSISPFE